MIKLFIQNPVEALIFYEWLGGVEWGRKTGSGTRHRHFTDYKDDKLFYQNVQVICPIKQGNKMIPLNHVKLKTVLNEYFWKPLSRASSDSANHKLTSVRSLEAFAEKRNLPPLGGAVLKGSHDRFASAGPT